ncbi:trimethylamine methyltransferase family protein [Limibaculum sp. M0105]|uniref:Methyltransferase n=2 Tax=Thermohalobaculum xanthum TaxID=2753746 RepID=A0A8J7M5P7_9RHOB|nr:trimethylamine methyltransferase family protein [Thermohalobaculum xanthum]
MTTGAHRPSKPVFRQPRLSYRPVEILPADRIEAIHEASLRILRDIGIRILSDEARRILREAGAMVDEASMIARLDPGLVMERVALAPERFTLEARNPAKSLKVGGEHLVFTSVAGPAFTADLDRGRRAGTLAEMRDYLRLIQGFDAIHQEGGGPFEALDVPEQVRHLDLQVAQITLMDKNWAPWTLGRVRVRDAVEMAARALGTTRDGLADRVVLAGVINTNSPLMLDVPMAEALIELARHGQAAIVTPFTLAGAMAPVTLTGALALQNAEALAGIVLAQCVRPGVPVGYGAFTTNVDMRTGSPAFGTPEYAQAAQISGQLARRYRIPFRSSGGTASNSCDAQAAYESQMSLWGAVMGGSHMIKHAAGWLNGGLTASFEKLVLDAETLAMMAAYLDPPEAGDDALALDAIATVGHGGHFFGAPHTLERYRTAFYAPLVSDWSNFETWSERGAESATLRANRIWKQRLADYEEPPLDAAIRDAVLDYAARRKREIGAGQDVPDC